MAFIEPSGGRPPRSARGIQQSTLERALSCVYSLPEGGHPTERPSNRALWKGRSVAVFWRAAAPKRAEGGPPRSARGIQQSTLERAFSGVYSLPEGGRPETCAASNRARWRGRLVAFAVFRRAAAPKRAGNLTEQFGESARGIQQSSLESAMSE